MVDQQLGKNRAEYGVDGADPTIDIVRDMIAQTESLPARVAKPKRTQTPRPAAAPRARVVETRQDFVATEPAQGFSQDQAEWAPADADSASPANVSETAPDVDWDDPFLQGDIRSYGIVDPETGDTVVRQGTTGTEIVRADPMEPAVQAPQIDVPPVPGVLSRATGAVVSAVARLIGRVGMGIWTAVCRFCRRPDAPRWLAILCLGTFAVVWPRDVLWLSLLFPIGVLITWASVGNAGCRELVARWHGRMKARDADKAERIRQRAKGVSAATGRVLSIFPKRWVKNVKLPDFEPEGYVPEALRVTPFEELAAHVHFCKQRGCKTCEPQSSNSTAESAM